MRAALSLAILVAAGPALAAEVKYATLPEPLGPSVIISGAIIRGDLQRLFWATQTAPPPKTVMLNSMGGDVREALKIGDEIASLRLKTVVSPFSTCASACALIWLAGSERFLVQGGKVGFHGAWETRDGVKVESGPGNALVGAYLGRRELNAQAIEFATAAQPDTANWIVGPGFERYGIAYTFVPYDQKNENAHGLLGGNPSTGTVTRRGDEGFSPPKKVETSVIGRDGSVLLDGAAKKDFIKRLFDGAQRSNDAALARAGAKAIPKPLPKLPEAALAPLFGRPATPTR